MHHWFFLLLLRNVAGVQADWDHRTVQRGDKEVVQWTKAAQYQKYVMESAELIARSSKYSRLWFSETWFRSWKMEISSDTLNYLWVSLFVSVCLLEVLLSRLCWWKQRQCHQLKTVLSGRWCWASSLCWRGWRGRRRSSSTPWRRVSREAALQLTQSSVKKPKSILRHANFLTVFLLKAQVKR